MPFTKRLVFPKFMKGLPNSDEYFDLYTKVREYFHDHNYSEQIIRNYFKIFVDVGYFDTYEKVLEKCLKIKSYGKALTLEKFKCLYGDEEGKKRWKSYCDRQAYTNSKEYKGMTDEEFKAYNKSRAITLKNMIKKYGEDEGAKRFKSYCDKQAYTNKKEYFIEKYGEDEGIRMYEYINKRKAHTFDAYLINNHGDKRKAYFDYLKYINKTHSFSSNIANNFFNELYDLIKIKINKCYTNFLNHEYSIYDKKYKRYFLYDFVIPDLKICIEYNGDLFHANPALFNINDHPNPYIKTLSSQQIWNHDNYKLSLIRQRGYEVIIIWEHDDNVNHKYEIEKVYNKILEKLNGKIKDNYEEW